MGRVGGSSSTFTISTRRRRVTQLVLGHELVVKALQVLQCLELRGILGDPLLLYEPLVGPQGTPAAMAGPLGGRVPLQQSPSLIPQRRKWGDVRPKPMPRFGDISTEQKTEPNSLPHFSITYISQMFLFCFLLERRIFCATVVGKVEYWLRKKGNQQLLSGLCVRNRRMSRHLARALPARSSTNSLGGMTRPEFSSVQLKDLPSYLRLHVLGNTRRLAVEFRQWYWRKYFLAGKGTPIIHFLFVFSGVGYLIHNHGIPPPPKQTNKTRTQILKKVTFFPSTWISSLEEGNCADLPSVEFAPSEPDLSL